MALYSSGSSTNGVLGGLIGATLGWPSAAVGSAPVVGAGVGVEVTAAVAGGSSGPRRPQPAARITKLRTSDSAAARRSDELRGKSVTERLRRTRRTIAETRSDARGG